MRIIQVLMVIGAALLLALPCSSQVRIKDIAGVQGARGNQLMGYGIVVGLDGSGDSNQTIFTAQSVLNTLKRLNINVDPAIIKVKNVAAVIVTADLPAFVKNGNRIDVTVSSLGDARSLQGGTLIQAPLQGADGSVYAVAQGPVSIGGFNVSAGGASAQKNHVNAGRIPAGAIVEREVPTSISDGSSVEVALKSPDFTTASRIADAVNEKMPETRSMAVDPYTVRVGVPAAFKNNLIGFLAQVETISVTPDTKATIVVNEKTGTVVISGDVRVNACAISHGSIQVKVENTPIVIPPVPFTTTKPVVVPQKDVIVKETGGKLGMVPASKTLDDLVEALNKLGVTTRDLISILQSMHAGGHISGEIVIQ
jgi:flagellar P-ring protein precursor FlgI